MRQHSHASDESSLRPGAARLPEAQAGRLGDAAAARRTDALSPDHLLELQRSVGNAEVASLVEEDRSPVHDVISSGGRPLEEPVRQDMEARLGHDFGDVRVHDDGAAHASARSVNASAYTVGSHIAFQRDVYDPSSTAGQRTLAHELTHVVQQRSGPVDGSPAAGGVRVSDPSDRFEREASATAEQVTASPAPGPAAGMVQRDAVEAVPVQQRDVDEEQEMLEEPTAQGLFVQRDEELEEDAE